MANMSAIYQYLGAEESAIPFLWLAAPLTGLIVQPLVGYYSDRTWTFLGRRRPYFLIGALLASLALIAMPNSSSLWMAAGLLWILDASVNISMEPFRAFVGDKLNREQRKTGFAMQSLLIGLGAVLSSSLPWVLSNWFNVSSESASGNAIPQSVHLAFYIGSFVFFIAVLYTILTTREYPPQDLEAFREENEKTAGVANAFREIFSGIASMPRTMKQLAVVQFFTWFGLFCMWIYFIPAVATHVFGGEQGGLNIKPVPGGAGSVSPSQRRRLPLLFLLLVRKYSAKAIHTICLTIGGLGPQRQPGRQSQPITPLHARGRHGPPVSSPCPTPSSPTPSPATAWASTWASLTSSSSFPRLAPPSVSVKSCPPSSATTP